jgi:geranylgeranyl pyrophosphate synthase
MEKVPSPKGLNTKLAEELLHFFEVRGIKTLEKLRKTVLEEVKEIESNEVREAMQYFITDYWQDLARPTLLSVCCETIGGNPTVTSPFAISLSILSGGIDIHDDIIDGSKRKHGRVTVYGKYGKDIALLVGDALIFKGFALLQSACAKTEKTKAKRIIEIVKRLFYELGDAEALELELRKKWEMKLSKYLRIIQKKAADVEAHARIGAILGNATQVEEENLAKYGRLLGMIIIIRDDIADLLDKQELKHRMKKEHLPLPLVYALKKQEISSKLSTEELFRNFNEEINKGIKQTQRLISKLRDEAYMYIKDFRTREILGRILDAFSIIN